MAAKNVLKKVITPVITPIQDFIERETSGGIILITCTLATLLIANSPLADDQYLFWHQELSVIVGKAQLSHTLAEWVNDALMAIFFLLVGLEIKTEIEEGELSTLKKAALPVGAALGGMLVPATIFAIFNISQETLRGWAIPMATDIAFALALVALLGKRVPISLKIFLAALAIADDLGAVLVIAIFYNHGLDSSAFFWMAGLLGVLFTLKVLEVKILTPYLLLGVLLWFFTLKSGIHATVSGVLLAFTIPSKTGRTTQQILALLNHRLRFLTEPDQVEKLTPAVISEELESAAFENSCPSHRLVSVLSFPVTYFILPVFAMVNTALPLDLNLISALFSPLALGVFLGLFIGKPLGVFGSAYLLIKLKLGQLPSGLNFKMLFGAGLLAGIGFTMSVFITLLAFNGHEGHQALSKLAILMASLLSGILGYGYLRFYACKQPQELKKV